MLCQQNATYRMEMGRMKIIGVHANLQFKIQCDVINKDGRKAFINRTESILAIQKFAHNLNMAL